MDLLVILWNVYEMAFWSLVLSVPAEDWFKMQYHRSKMYFALME